MERLMDNVKDMSGDNKKRHQVFSSETLAPGSDTETIFKIIFTSELPEYQLHLDLMSPVALNGEKQRQDEVFTTSTALTSQIDIELFIDFWLQRKKTWRTFVPLQNNMASLLEFMLTETLIWLIKTH